MGLNAYSTCSPIAIGCYLYQDSGLTTPVADGSYSDGVTVYAVSGGAGLITSTAACPATTTTTTTSTTTSAPTTTTTTTSTTTAASTTTTTSTTSTTTAAPVYIYGLGNGVNGNDSCANFATPSNYYSGSLGLNNGSILYQDMALTIFASDGFYSDGIRYWLITGGNGVLTSQTSCGLTTTTTTSTTTGGTTTTTTTSTTTIANPDLEVYNASLDITVSNVSVNGVTATCITGSYPIPAGETRQLDTTQIGTYDITVTWSSSISGQHITVTDSNGTPQCQGAGNGSNITLTFPNCVVDGVTAVIIDVADGVC